MITAPGVYLDITPEEYFGNLTPERALSASGVKTLLTATPAEFHAPPKKSNAAQRRGDVSHQLALGKGRGYAFGEYAAWNSNDAKKFKADAEAAGLTPVKAHEFAECERQADVMRVRIEQTLADLNGGVLPEYQTEAVMVWREETAAGPIWCKLMADVWCASLGIILDPKFTSRLGDGVFEAHATAMGWDIQAAWYQRGATVLHPEMAGRIRFANLCVHPDPPHVSRAREADEATRYSCETEIDRAKEIFGRCLYADEWPGYPRGIEPWTARARTINERMTRAAMEDAE
jgi:hypothetical protein